MVQHDAVEVSTEDTQHHGLFIVDQGRGKRHTHSRQRHGFSQFHVQVLVHDLCHDIQPAGGCIAVEQNTQPDADHQNIAQHVQLLTAGHRAELREQLFKQPQKHRQQHTGVYGLCAKFSAAGKEPDDEKHDVQDHRNDRQGQRHKIGQHDAKAGNAADGCMARHQKKKTLAAMIATAPVRTAVSLRTAPVFPFTSLIFVPLKSNLFHRFPHLCRCGQGAYRQSVCIP